MDDPPEFFRGTGGRSTLQQVVRAHFDGFQTDFEDEHGGRSLPQYVLKEFRALLECGDPAFGFTRIRCPSCATDMILPFSCKGRTFCSSCGGRQMAQTAAHLVDRVFPDVAVRQWVLSVPKPLRLAMAMHADFGRDVARAHIRAVSASYIRRAKATLALEEEDTGAQAADCPAKAPGSAVQFHPGAVNSTQRFASNLALDGAAQYLA